MKNFSISILFVTLTILAVLPMIPANAQTFGVRSQFNITSNDINTLAGKVAAVNAAGLNFHFSGLIEQEADISEQSANPAPTTPITPSFVLTSPLDASSVAAPDVTVNQDTAAASQNEPAVAVDPNNANRIVVGANDYVTRTWTCTISGTPCSALGDGYSGTYFSNNGGTTW
jgi:hypothetical protein